MLRKFRETICVWLGHSKIQTSFWGYWYCGRCGTQVGDNLGGVYSGEGIVLVGCNCKACGPLYKSLGWRDKWLVPNPFDKTKWEKKDSSEAKWMTDTMTAFTPILNAYRKLKLILQKHLRIYLLK